MKKVIFMGLCLLGVAGAQGQQWEYAEYTETDSGGATQFSFVHRTSTQATFWKANVKELGVGAGCNLPTANRPAFFNCVGQQGWEMVSMVDTGKRVQVYFKRPAN